MDVIKILENVEHGGSRDYYECPECKEEPHIEHNHECNLKALIDALRSGRLVVVDKESTLIYRPLRAGEVINKGDECWVNERGPWKPVDASVIGDAYYPWNGGYGHHVAMRRGITIKKEQGE